MATLIPLCNQALAGIGKAPIADLDEGSLEARECQRFAEPLLAEMVEWSDCLPFAQKRAVLAVVTNDRPAEWMYAYAAPSDMAAPIAIREVEEPADYLPKNGPFTFPRQDTEPFPFLHEAGKIYANVETATLVYTRDTIDVSELPALGQRAFVTELQARLAMPLTKDARIEQGAMQKAEIARVRWLADEENKNPRPAVRYTSEAEWARRGYVV